MQIGGQWRHVLSAHRARDHHRCDGFSRHRRDSWRPRSTQGRNNTEGYRRREERTDANDLQHPSDRGAADTRSMKRQVSGVRCPASAEASAGRQGSGKSRDFLRSLKADSYQLPAGSRGVTLVEMIVAVALFEIVVLFSAGALLALVGANRKAQALPPSK